MEVDGDEGGVAAVLMEMDELEAGTATEQQNEAVASKPPQLG